MRLSCEHLPKVCPLCLAQKSPTLTLPAKIEATILKEGWRSCAWQLARQCPRSEISRALAACLDSQARRSVLAKDLAGTDVAPERGHGLVTRLLHDDELAHADQFPTLGTREAWQNGSFITHDNVTRHGRIPC